jgi:hypothetical protein
LKKKKRKAGGINCEGDEEENKVKKWTLTNFLDNDEEIKRHFESYEDAHIEQQWTGGRLEFLEVEGEEKELFNETLGITYTVSKK